MACINRELAPEKGQYAVIFFTEREPDLPEYKAMNDALMLKLEGLDGYMGMDAFRGGPKGVDGVSVSYWRDEASIAAWSADLLHRQAKARGRGEWYDAYRVVVCQIDRAMLFTRG
ncbi:MAG: antibiotic biosynthesis monooxygenase [Flavobacteriales bacterium]|nr:antibiotic biosynthesis monooxygenase [Flavobacteriales bacterium]